jgi:hypothetical protein
MCFQAIGSIYAGNAARAASRANAAALNEAGEMQMQAAEADAARLTTQARLVQGQSRANAAASGLQLDGSPLEALAFSAGQQARDIEAALIQGRMERREMRGRAALERWQGNQAQTAGFIRAGTALLGSAGSWGGFGGGGTPAAPDTGRFEGSARALRAQD